MHRQAQTESQVHAQMALGNSRTGLWEYQFMMPGWALAIAMWLAILANWYLSRG